MSELAVYYETRLVGHIHVRDEGPSFIYAPQWLQTKGAFPISVLMPLTHRPVEPRVFLPWAENLLPEAGNLRAVSLRLGASLGDVIGILKEIGRDTAGALSIGQPGSPLPGGWKRIPNADALERIINELPSKPFLVGDEGVSMSLAGAQTKIGVALDVEGHLCIPIDGAPSTYILKPDAQDRLFGSVQNEALCMTLAKRVGLPAPAITTGVAGARSYLLVARYDRVQQGDRWRRLHQEDFCQALGRPPSAKYQSNQSGISGPSLSEMFALARNVMQVPDVMSLLDYVIFNAVTCNTDAHAKNYSMMISGRGFTLAPIYDVLCAAVYPHVTRNSAQKIGGKTRAEHLKRRHWERMAVECGLSPQRVVPRISRLAELTMRELPAAMSEVEAMPAGGNMLPLFREQIELRARALLSGLADFTGSMQQAKAVPKRIPSSQIKRRGTGASTRKNPR